MLNKLIQSYVNTGELYGSSGLYIHRIEWKKPKYRPRATIIKNPKVAANVDFMYQKLRESKVAK